MRCGNLGEIGHAESAFGPDEQANLSDGARERFIGAGRTRVERDLEGIVGHGGKTFVERGVAIDRRRRVAPGLLASTLRDLSPMGEAAVGARRIESHDAMIGFDGTDPADAELRGFLHDEVHGVVLYEGLDERYFDGRFR